MRITSTSFGGIHQYRLSNEHLRTGCLMYLLDFTYQTGQDLIHPSSQISREIIPTNDRLHKSTPM